VNPRYSVRREFNHTPFWNGAGPGFGGANRLDLSTPLSQFTLLAAIHKFLMCKCEKEEIPVRYVRITQINPSLNLLPLRHPMLAVWILHVYFSGRSAYRLVSRTTETENKELCCGASLISEAPLFGLLDCRSWSFNRREQVIWLLLVSARQLH
jgi:hypothetical protein